MRRNLILGSGIVGLLARFILGDDWEVVPFWRSRFYSYNPPLGDNHVTADDQITPVVAGLGLATTPVLYRRAYSVGGQLVQDQATARGLIGDWLAKTFDGRVPPHAPAYLSSRTQYFVYSGVRVNRLYRQLQARYRDELLAGAAAGQPDAAGDHWVSRGGRRHEFDRAVSTVPLGALLGLLGRGDGPPSAPLQYLHLQTHDLDFEGANQVMVVDRMFSFCLVTRIAPTRYLFCCHQDIPNPGEYLMPIVRDYDLLDGTRIDGALPLGPMPDLKFLEPLDIFPVGAHAQHDWCADVGSNMLRLVRYAERGHRPKDGLRVIVD